VVADSAVDAVDGVAAVITMLPNGKRLQATYQWGVRG